MLGHAGVGLGDDDAVAAVRPLPVQGELPRLLHVQLLQRPPRSLLQVGLGGGPAAGWEVDALVGGPLGGPAVRHGEEVGRQIGLRRLQVEGVRERVGRLERPAVVDLEEPARQHQQQHVRLEVGKRLDLDRQRRQGRLDLLALRDGILGRSNQHCEASRGDLDIGGTGCTAAATASLTRSCAITGSARVEEIQHEMWSTRRRPSSAQCGLTAVYPIRYISPRPTGSPRPQLLSATAIIPG